MEKSLKQVSIKMTDPRPDITAGCNEFLWKKRKVDVWGIVRVLR